MKRRARPAVDAGLALEHMHIPREPPIAVNVRSKTSGSGDAGLDRPDLGDVRRRDGVARAPRMTVAVSERRVRTLREAPVHATDRPGLGTALVVRTNTDERHDVVAHAAAGAWAAPEIVTG